MNKEFFVFNHFKGYAAYCLQQTFPTICSCCFNSISSKKSLLLHFLPLRREEELERFIEDSLRVFFKSSISDNAIIEATVLSEQYKNYLTHHSKHLVTPSDIIWYYEIRKKVLVAELPNYTDDVSVAVKIVQELNDFTVAIIDSVCEVYNNYVTSFYKDKINDLLETNALQQKQLLNKMDAERRMIQEKEFSELLLNHCIDGIVAYDTSLKITAWNKVLERQNGLTKEKVLGTRVFELFPGYKDTEEGKAMLEVLKGKPLSLADKPYKNKRGFYELHLVPINSEGKITGGLCIIRDITYRKLAEDKIKSREAQLREAQEIARLGSWEWYVKSEKLICSDEMYVILGYKPKEIDLSVELISKYIHPDEVVKVDGILKDAFYRVGEFAFETKIIARDSSLKHLLVKGKVLSFNHIPYKMMGIVLDVTERVKRQEELHAINKALQEKNEALKKAQEELSNSNSILELRVKERTRQLSEINQALEKEVAERVKAEMILKEKNDELSKINSDLDNFVYAASHDLKAPISNIEGLISVLENELNSEKREVKEILHLVNQSIAKFKGTIQDLSEIGKVNKSFTDDVVDIDLFSLVEEIKLSINDMLLSNKAEIVVDCERKPCLKFSKANLKSILYNLLSNAIKYRHPHRVPKVYVYCGCENGEVVIKVRDNGLGIEDCHKDKIFGMFKRLHDHVDGTGVGLYIVKRIIDNNNGRIEVNTKLHEGTEFCIYLKE
ncbi:MAG TPA: ATP-binding protein [Cytophagaceae bacterium]